MRQGIGVSSIGTHVVDSTPELLSSNRNGVVVVELKLAALNLRHIRRRQFNPEIGVRNIVLERGCSFEFLVRQLVGGW